MYIILREIPDGTLVELAFLNGTIAFLTSTSGTFVLLVYSLWYPRVLLIYTLLISNCKTNCIFEILAKSYMK